MCHKNWLQTFFYSTIISLLGLHRCTFNFHQIWTKANKWMVCDRKGARQMHQITPTNFHKNWLVFTALALAAIILEYFQNNILWGWTEYKFSFIKTTILIDVFLSVKFVVVQHTQSLWQTKGFFVFFDAKNKFVAREGIT